MHRLRGLAALTLALASTITVGALAPPAGVVQAASVPAGFTDATVAGFGSPTAVEWMPGDRLVVLEKSGRVRVGRPAEAFTTAIDLDVCTEGERGLLGFTHDPGFSTNRHVYVYYTRSAGSTCVNRVSRFSMGIDDVIDPASEFVLLDNISSINTNHNGGDLDIGSDGYLYVSVGDAGRDPRGDSGSGGDNDAAQDLTLLNGKILRITRDGQPAPGNPLNGPGTARCATRGNTAATPDSNCQEIFAWGLRNPYRIAFDRNDGTDQFFINDVGQNTFEEVDDGQLGANYGWPIREGSCPQGDIPPCDPPPAPLVDPITSYGRTLGKSITGGAFVPNGLWPDEYDGAYLFGDYVEGNIFLRTADGNVDYGTPFANGAAGLTDMTFGFHKGRAVLYYTTFSEVRMISPPSPTPPSDLVALKMIPVDPYRAYDTIDDTGGPAGDVFAGTTRLVDLDPPDDGYVAALVNITMAGTAGAGWVRTWGTADARPPTSSLNADAAGSIVGNATVVPLVDGAFVLESSTSTRVVVDVMAFFEETGPGNTDDGRLIAIEPFRLADTREPAGEQLPSDSTNPWSETDHGWDVGVTGEVGIPDDGTVAAVVLALTIISDGDAGWAGAYPGGGTWSTTSNVNVAAGDLRNNLVIVPVDETGFVSFETFNLANLVVDVVAYVTSDAAEVGSVGLYSDVGSARAVDTRIDLGFGPLQAETTATETYVAGASAALHNLTVTNTSAAGHLAAHPNETVPFVSNLNWSGPGQTRGVLAITQVDDTFGTVSFTSLVGTDLVVDVFGIFSDD